MSKVIQLSDVLKYMWKVHTCFIKGVYTIQTLQVLEFGQCPM